MKRRTKAQRIKDFRARMSDRARRGWRVRHLRMMANPREPTFEEIIARGKADRKGAYYATWVRDGLTLTLYYATVGRSDQFDVVAVRPSRFDGAPDVETRAVNLSLPKVLKLFI